MTITTGSQITVASANSFPIATATLGTAKAIHLFADSSAGDMKTIILEISALTVTKGTAVTLDAAETVPVVDGSSITANGSSEAVAAFIMNPGGSRSSKAVVLSISGTTITVNSILTIETNTGVQSAISIDTLETDKYIVIYARDNPSDLVSAFVITQSGTTLTDQTPLTLETSLPVVTGPVDVVATSSSRAFAVYENAGASGMRASLLNISGNTVTEVDDFDFEVNANLQFPFRHKFIAKLSATKVAVAYAVSGVAKLIILEDTGAAISGGTVLTPAPDDPHHLAPGIDSSSFMVASASSDIEFETFNVSGTTITASGDNAAIPNSPTLSLLAYLGSSKWISTGAKSNTVEAVAFSSSADAYAYTHSSTGIPGSII
jgi:hypothetical protein